MEGRFRKVLVSKYALEDSGGIFINNNNAGALFTIMKEKFGKPNGNSLRTEESTWKYILEYQGVYLSVYDYNEYWSIGFLELDKRVPDYELIFAISRMLFDFLKKKLDAKIGHLLTI